MKNAQKYLAIFLIIVEMGFGWYLADNYLRDSSEVKQLNVIKASIVLEEEEK